MNAIAYTDDRLAVNFDKRMLRAASAMILAGTFLTGMWVTPVWICIASAASIYLMTWAILDRGIAGALSKTAAVQDSSAETNMDNGSRVARGAAAGAALGGVVADPAVSAYLLDAADIFALSTIGVYLAVTGITAWDPVNVLFGAGARRTEATGPVLRPRVGALPNTGPVSETRPQRNRHAA